MASNRIIAEIARKGGSKVFGRVVDTLVPVDGAVQKTSLIGGIAAALAVRIATRSVPGALIVGGSLLAKRLYDKRHARRGSGGAGKGKTDDKA